MYVTRRQRTQKYLLYIVRSTQQCGAKLSYATINKALLIVVQLNFAPHCCVRRTINNKLLYWHNGMEYT